MIKSSIQKIIPLFFLTMLSGCALVPGMKLDNDQQHTDNNTSASLNPIIVPITPTVIHQVMGDLNPYVYHIGRGDQLSIAVWGYPELSSPVGQTAITQSSNISSAGTQLMGVSGQPTNNTGVDGYLVDSNGDIFFPLVGYVHVVGLSEQQAAAVLSKRLLEYIKNPQVMLQVGSFVSQKVYVMGQLNQGQQPAALIPINETPMTLAYALSAVGGINQATADTRQIYIIRGSFTNPTVYWLNAESPAAMLYADNFPLMNHDVVFVSTAAVVRWNYVLNQILPTIQAIWFTNSLVNP